MPTEFDCGKVDCKKLIRLLARGLTIEERRSLGIRPGSQREMDLRAAAIKVYVACCRRIVNLPPSPEEGEALDTLLASFPFFFIPVPAPGGPGIPLTPGAPSPPLFPPGMFDKLGLTAEGLAADGAILLRVFLVLLAAELLRRALRDRPAGRLCRLDPKLHQTPDTNSLPPEDRPTMDIPYFDPDDGTRQICFYICDGVRVAIRFPRGDKCPLSLTF